MWKRRRRKKRRKRCVCVCVVVEGSRDERWFCSMLEVSSGKHLFRTISP